VARARIPLFPLGSVLFPGLLLPLHIFEQRYRTLVQELTELPESWRRRFGVVAIRAGREVGADDPSALYPVGCVADLRRVERFDDGRFDIVTTGGARFVVRDVGREKPYLTAEVDLLDEPVGDEAQLLTARVGSAFTAYVEALAEAKGDQIELPTLPEDALLLSYLVAATMVLDVSDKQRLLAEPDAAGRLRTGLALLTRETAMLSELSAVPSAELLAAPATPN
jgi:Lon protease-like protein